MTLASWEAKGWLHQHRISRQDVLELLHEAESDLRDARRELFAVWNFNLACTAALNLCTLLLHASGYRPGDQPLLKVVHTLPMILGEDRKADADYLDSCLHLRNQNNLESTDTVTAEQACELVRFVEDFYLRVVDWLRSWDSALVVNSDIALISDTEWGLSLVET